MVAPESTEDESKHEANGTAALRPTDPAPTQHDLPVAHPDVTAADGTNGIADAPIFEALVAEHGTSPV